MRNPFNLFGVALVACATLGLVFPLRLLADDSNAFGHRSVRRVDTKVFDIVLASGVLTGRVVDHSGVAVNDAEVLLTQGVQEIARTRTDRIGVFTFSSLKGGVYTASSGNASGAYRLWTEKTAPPVANAQALLILGQNGTRGQYAAVDGGGNLLIATMVLISLAVGIGTLIEVENLQRKVDRIPQSP